MRFVHKKVLKKAWFLAWFCAGFVACGGGTAPESKMAEPREPQTAEDAQREFDAARAELESKPATMGAAAHEESQPDHPQAHESDCARLCRAFQSMQRAQAALCRLAGEEDPRCAQAKAQVAESAKRVVQCACPT